VSPTLGPGSVIAIDHGTLRTGFAVVDALRLGIEPLPVYHGAGQSAGLLDHVQALAEERTLAALLLGLPLHADGSEGARAKDVRQFAAKLSERLPKLPMLYRDEHLTTKEAESRLIEAGHTGAARKARKDSWSALVLLEDWMRAGEPAE
jgi:putative Holliday junction resolvase